MINVNMIKDSMYYASSDCAKTYDQKTHACGVITGLVSGIMYGGATFEQAIAVISRATLSCRWWNAHPILEDCVPGAWVEEFKKHGLVK